METLFMLNIVVARRGEDVRWIDDLPEHCTVTVYSDDASLGLPLDIVRHIDLVRLPGQHGLGELYLSHLSRLSRLKNRPPSPEEAFTVFCPGDPLQASPDFFELLDVAALWGDVQPLSGATEALADTASERDRLADLRITPVRFDLRSWAPLGAFDKALYRLQQRYRQANRLSDHDHPAVHFLEKCQLGDLAQAVGRHDLGIRDGGLVFAVRQSRITDWLAAHAEALPQVSEWLRLDPSHGRIWDQFWLHLFGLPFVRLEGLPHAETRQGDEEDALDDFSLSHALAAIDDTLARLAPPPLASHHRPSALQVARARARAAASGAQAATRPAAPVDSLALQELAELSDRAAHAFRQGDFQYATACARLALKQDAHHGASRFTLAMALAAQGLRDEALEQFEVLGTSQRRPAHPNVPNPTPAVTPAQ
jgi:tetratricopeptide (TPR) repeat protein